jgi:Arc/MetJ-type ribon-helix-helix transcriptional regulator
MVRTQVSLTEHQHQVLRRLSKERGVSLAELVRQAVERFAAERDEDAVARAIAVMGKRTADVADASVRHDEYLAEEIAR